jgi:pre-mRNA-splicing factor ISY1
LTHDEDEEVPDEEHIYAVEEVSKESNLVIYLLRMDSQSDDEDVEKKKTEGDQKFIAHVPVPSQQEVEQALLRRRKQELLEKYGVQEQNQSL